MRFPIAYEAETPPVATPRLQWNEHPLIGFLAVDHNKLPGLELNVKLGMSENGVYPQWNSHLVGIMISKTIGYNGVHYFQTNPIKAVLQEAVPFQSVGFPSPTALSISVLPPVSNFQTKEQVAVSPHCLTPAGTQPHGVQKKSNALFESLSIFP